MPCSRLRELWDFIKKKYPETSKSYSRHPTSDEANYTLAVNGHKSYMRAAWAASGLWLFSVFKRVAKFLAMSIRATHI
jgi:hypothetical protein